jgi:hypothetical protein
MRTHARRAVSLILGLAVTCGMSAAGAPAVKRPPAKDANPKTAKTARPPFRPSKAAAGQEAAKFGALVGNGCNGKADIPLNERQWVVLCSNGKTFVVEQSGSAPPVECSLSGAGPQPACFQ